MSDNVTKNVLIVGVGGQGILLASEVLSRVAMLAGLDVKKSEVHGMSQRGGSVSSHVRFGEQVLSPIIPEGAADVLVALEKLEALRWSGFLSPDGVIIVNDFRLDPASVATGKIPYTENAIGLIQSLGHKVVVVDGVKKALEAGDLRCMNVVVLGALSRLLEFPEELWRRTLEDQVNSRFIEVNRRAFELGRGVTDNTR